jgi:hypothetical protein
MSLQEAPAHGAPRAPVLLLLGETYARGGDDTGAVTDWNQARGGSVDGRPRHADGRSAYGILNAVAFGVALRAVDPQVRTRRLDLPFYIRRVRIDEI